MHGACFHVAFALRLAAVLLLAALWIAPGETRGQSTQRSGPSKQVNPPSGAAANPRLRGPQYRPIGPEVLVLEVRIVGNRNIPEHKIRLNLHTRKDRLFDPEIVQADVRQLVASKQFSNVRTYTEKRPQGMVVTFEVFERPTIEYFKIVGNRALGEKSLKKKAGLEVGESLNYYSVEQARRNIEDHYRAKGHSQTEVVIIEGKRPRDHGVVLMVNESKVQRIWKVEFVGNTIANDGRLKTQIQSKPGFLKYFFKGKANRNKIDEDVDRLTAYYRNLGYFNAKVGPELIEGRSGDWLTLRFVINEGKQYTIRNVSVVGNRKYTSDELSTLLGLKSGDTFHAGKMSRDINTLKDLYGGQGHYFAKIQADPRFLEDSPQLDLIYDIDEGAVYRVGRINVYIGGEFSHTRQNVVLNRLSLRPGDIIDTREIRNSVRRLKASQLFENKPAQNMVPRIVIRPPEVTELAERQEGRRTTRYRGQSPEGRTAREVRYVDVNIFTPQWAGR